MAKGTITKAKKGHSIHSRAARRATSPGIDTDKSLKNARPPQESVDRRPAVLAVRHVGGITKKAKSGRKAVLSTKARRRHEQSMSRAEAIMDRTAVKVQKSKGHAKVINSRKKTWDEINKEAFDRAEEQRKLLSKKEKAKMEEDAMVEAFYADDGDAEMKGADDLGETVGSVETTLAPAVSMPVAAAEEEEEIL
ncbi:Alb1-domain-containing protein [Corynascus similis CBS 632.67]